MYQRITRLILRLLKVPHEPVAPHGHPASLRVFRAGENFLKLKLIGWGIAQLLAFAGIIFWLTVFINIEQTADTIRDSIQRTEQQKTATQVTPPTSTPTEPAAPVAKKRPARTRENSFALWQSRTATMVAQWPLWIFPLIWALKGIGILAYFVQLPITYLIARMDYELRWYMVTDRSLRIRYGVWKVAESTMSFANIQQVVVTQGPLQRLLGLSDVKVQSAGGGNSENPHHGGNDMHMGLFHSVTNGSDIRDLILERLRRFRESGLGDPEEHGEATADPAISSSADLLTAAQELASEARALRASVS